MIADPGLPPVYGNGQCAVRHCTKRCEVDQLMCREHWYEVPAVQRQAVLHSLKEWYAGRLTLGQLREVQDKAVASVTDPHAS
jgi:hypothetical protein